MTSLDQTDSDSPSSQADNVGIRDLDRAGKLRSLRAAIAGNLLEWFDWTLYALFSTYIAASFFDTGDPTSALLSTLLVFAGGFLARPIGGLVFGRLADRKGRKFSLVATMMTMAAGSLVIALIPSYTAIGVWSSVLLLAARLMQGLAHGGEAGTSYAYIAEIAPREKRGFWASSVFTAVTVGVMTATLLAALITGILPKDAVGAWGWRVAFVIGALLGVYALFLRRNAAETIELEPETAESAAAEPEQVSDAERRRRRRLILRFGGLVLMLSAGQNAWYYTWGTFASSYAISAHGMDANGAFIASLLAQLVTVCFLPFAGRLSDRIGRRPMMMTFGLGSALLVFPIHALLGQASWTLFVSQAIGMLLWACAAGMYPALMSELVSTRTRAAGVGFATSLSVALFGGTAPYLNTWFTSVGQPWIFQIYVAALCVLAFFAAWIMPETKGINLADDDVIQAEGSQETAGAAKEA